jgi:hypothetical protein
MRIPAKIFNKKSININPVARPVFLINDIRVIKKQPIAR